MNWFLHNFIADMYGPHFLLFYSHVIVVTLAVCWWSIAQARPDHAPASAVASCRSRSLRDRLLAR